MPAAPRSPVDRLTTPVLGQPIDVIDWGAALTRIEHWAQGRESRYVCITNVHSVVTATRDPAFAQALQGADMATPDGAPVAWMLRRLGNAGQQRINGPDLMQRYCALAARSGTPVFLLGSTDEVLASLRARLLVDHPGLQIAGVESPPFRPLTMQEDVELVQRINHSRPGVVFVSLGCPKQELWMAQHRGRVQAAMVGVGAAFDFHAGLVSRAPLWMRNAGLEWLHRLLSEPRRLWKRYLVTNTLFILGAARQLMERTR